MHCIDRVKETRDSVLNRYIKALKKKQIRITDVPMQYRDEVLKEVIGRKPVKNIKELIITKKREKDGD